MAHACGSAGTVRPSRKSPIVRHSAIRIYLYLAPLSFVPKSLFATAKLQVRVLATSGIATGYVEETITLDDHTPSGVSVMLVGHDPTVVVPQPLARAVLHAVAADAAGRQIPNDSIVWYDTGGTELGRGAYLDMRSLPHGQYGAGGRPPSPGSTCCQELVD